MWAPREGEGFGKDHNISSETGRRERGESKKSRVFIVQGAC